MIGIKNFVIRFCGFCVAAVLALPMNAQNVEPIVVDGCRPLLAPDCVVDEMVEEVKVIDTYQRPDYAAVLDANLDNSAEIPFTVAQVGLLYPIISIRDMKNKYAGGQDVGFVVGSNFQLLNADLLKNLVVALYNDNELVDVVSVENSFGLLSVNILSGKGTNTLSVSVPKEKDGVPIVFDEVMLASTGVGASVAGSSVIYYGFVGNGEEKLQNQSDGDKKYKSEYKPYSSLGIGYINEWKENDFANGVPFKPDFSLGGLLLGKPFQLRVSYENGFAPQNAEVGFIYQNTALLDIDFFKNTTIVVTNTETSKSKEYKLSSDIASIDAVANETDACLSVRVDADFQWNQVTLQVSGLNILGDLLTSTSFKYAYVKRFDIPAVSEQCELNLSADALVCADTPSWELNSDVAVNWVVDNVIAEDGQTDITAGAKGTVSFAPSSDGLSTTVSFVQSPQGVYTFRATDEHNCSGTVKIVRGKTDAMKNETAKVVTGTVLNDVKDQVHLSTADEGALISIDNLENSANILDGNLTTYATYAKGLQLLSHTGIVSVKKNSGVFDDNIAVVGYVTEIPNNLLGADVLKFYNIVLYKDGHEVYSSVTEENNTVHASLLGGAGSSKVRYAINIPEEYRGKFDEFALYTSGLLNLDLTDESLRIYGAFTSDEEESSVNINPLDQSGVLPILQTTTGATFNYQRTGNAGLASVVTVLSGLGYILDGHGFSEDGNEKGVESYAVANVLGATDISIKTGRRFSGGRWIGMVMKKPAGLGDVDLLSQTGLTIYNKGEEVGRCDKENNFLSANLIGWGDYAYISYYTDQPFDEVTFRKGELVKALEGVQYLGFYTYADTDGDGIPDEEDPDFCESSDPDGENDVVVTSPDGMVNGHICASALKDAVLTVSGQWNGLCLLKNTDNGNVVLSEDVAVTSGYDYKIYLEGMEYGRYELSLLPDDVLEEPVNMYFKIHATRTEWRPRTVSSTDWNDWDNWTAGSPIAGCTDVVIPSGSLTFPILESDVSDGDMEEEGLSKFGCRYIYFAPNTELQNTQLLDYEKVWVDLDLKAGRYYMLSMPLKSVVTGDFFVPYLMNGIQNNDLFESLDETTSPENRFNPRIYQRVWKNSAPVVSKNDNGTGTVGTVGYDATFWTPPFNALNYKYTLGTGFSLKADAGTVTNTMLRFRFPKEHQVYYYYNEKGQKTDVCENIGRDFVGRFITENENGETIFPLTFTVTAEGEDNKAFLIGNPFMSHINIKSFLDANPEITSLKVYDGNTINSAILYDGELLVNSNDGQSEWTSIAPMQSFFATVGNAGNQLSVTFDENMLEINPKGQELRTVTRTADSGDSGCPVEGFRLTVSDGDIQAGALVGISNQVSDTYVDGEDASLLVDDEVKPKLAVYTLSGDMAADIQQQTNQKPVEIGFYMDYPKPVTLKVDKTIAGEWQLLDRQTGLAYDLGETTDLNLGTVGTNVGRWIITPKNDIQGLSSAVFVEQAGHKWIVSTDGTTEIIKVSCSDVNGAMIGHVESAGKTTETVASIPGINVLEIVTSDGKKHVLKVIAYE